MTSSKSMIPHRDATQPTIFTYRNLGIRWAFDWLSYIEDDPSDLDEPVESMRGSQLGQIDAVVVVRWRTEDVDHPPPQLRSGLGCEFVIIDPEMGDRIDQFIDRFVELADKLEE